MPRYRNLKPSILGLNTKSQTVDDKGAPVPGESRTVMPGEVFEAEKDEIPEVYFQQRWLEETRDEVTNPAAVAPGTNVGPYSDKNPDPPVAPPQPLQNPDGSTADQPGNAPQTQTTPDGDTTETPKKKRW